jgi:hypothetical protein
MKAYVFLAIGAAWLIAAIIAGLFYYHRGFGIFWNGEHDPALALRLFLIVFYVLFLGWIAPVLFGVWLLWKSKNSN